MKIHQNFVTLAAALGFALLLLLVNMVLQAPDGMMRMGYAAALYLLSRDTLITAALAKGPRRASNPDRWVYAFYLALFFGTFMLLALWRGMEALPAQIVGTAIGASLFGILMAFLPGNTPAPYAHHFHTDPPRGRARTLLSYLIPPLQLVVIWVLVQVSPPTPAHLFFFIILMGFNTPRFRRKTNGNFLWAYFPFLVGFTVLVAVFFGFR